MSAVNKQSAPLMKRLRKASVDDLLRQWGREYGYGGIAGVGWPGQSTIARETLFTGQRGARIPTATEADRVERVVRELERTYWREMQVLRCEYWMTYRAPVHVRCRRLRAIGVEVSKTGYYRLLDEAREHFCAAWWTGA